MTSKKVNVDFCLAGFSATKIVTCKCHVDESSKDGHDTILGRYLLNALLIDIILSKLIVIGNNGTFEGFSASMVCLIKYFFTSLIDKLVKPEEYFINSYVDECF